MSNNNKKQPKTPASKIALRVFVIFLAALMIAGFVGLIISGCQAQWALS